MKLYNAYRLLAVIGLTGGILGGINPCAATLRELAAACGIKYGTCDGPLSDAPFAALMARECNIITAQSCLKFSATEPQQNQFNFGSPDALAQFCQQNNIQFRGHCLVWHQALSSWVTNGNFNRQQMLAILKNHISTVVGRYKGRIVEWDVVNEAIADTGSGLRSTVWRTRIGDDYLDSAFVYAHRADTNALLYYNDYGAEGLGKKANAVYSLVAGMKQRGVPIYGVGLQCHATAYSVSGSLAEMDANIKRLGALGLKVSITELDVSVPLPAYPQYFLQQGRDYKALMQVFLANRPVCKNFITWGLSDKYYWKPSTYLGDPLLFDRSFKPKPAYDSLISVLTTTADVQDEPRPGRVAREGKVTGAGVLYSVTGVPVAADKHRNGNGPQVRNPGIYILRSGNSVSKILVFK